MMAATPTASYSITVRAKVPDQPGMFARVATVVGEAGGSLGAIDLVEVRKAVKVRDITIAATDEVHAHHIVQAIRRVPGIQVVSVSDRTFLMHLGGKIEVQSKRPLQTRDDLSMAYTPGVARVCRAIAEDPRKVFQLTIKRNTVAVLTDGTAILGLGDLGPEAALPVMEGKAMLFKEFGGVDAFPICLNTRDVEEIVQTAKHISPVFGGINLEDISAPRCFEIEDRLRAELDIPVFHDDQHGTAVVVLAALINALKIVGKSFEQIKVVVAGAGAAGMAVSRILLAQNVRNLVVCDRDGALTRRQTDDLHSAQRWLALHTNLDQEEGPLAEVIAGADVFIGVSGPNVLTAAEVRKMAPDAILFAMANPVPEIMPEEAGSHVRVMATGRSDYPNQINNVLCFPGLFRGVLDCRATDINEEMKVAAAHAIAQVVTDRELSEDYIIPSVFNRKVAEAVARAVARAAVKSGVARRLREE
jgi:malate dehydrogenase (oxaloacetate-decarboxylating)